MEGKLDPAWLAPKPLQLAMQVHYFEAVLHSSLILKHANCPENAEEEGS